MLEGGPDKRAFDHGIRANYREVFGFDRKLWFLPIFSSGGDGSVYRTRQQGGYVFETAARTCTSPPADSRNILYATQRDNTAMSPPSMQEQSCRSKAHGVAFERWEASGCRAAARYSLLTQVEAAELLNAASSDSEDEII
ncbi:hypothetical protein NECAME_05901 [Necator americanus]|uniref:Uncharacterized protein n=1 Tax=Necator americanus TaxID=51031 RepID=W2TZY1_NECAM|nr:hypothetical protein NECAME_05901 [Necator americanus]ETN86597.1 hypothetical protein NECAME_05901 [Necator americanus]